jgi:hypothetical protein
VIAAHTTRVNLFLYHCGGIRNPKNPLWLYSRTLSNVGIDVLWGFFRAQSRNVSISRRGGDVVLSTKIIRRDESARYCIRFLGVLDATWIALLGEMMFTTVELDEEKGTTSLRGLAMDQAALLGVLNFAYDLGMVLLLVELEPEQLQLP